MDAFDDLNDVHDVQQHREQIQAIQVQHLLHDRQDPFHLFDEKQFIRRVRFRKATVLDIINLIALDIAPPTRKHFAISAHVQVLLALSLSFYATGSFQVKLGDGLFPGTSVTMCRIIRRVSEALAR